MVGGFAPVRSADSQDEVFKEYPLLVRHEVSCQVGLHCRYQLESRSGVGGNPFCQHALATNQEVEVPFDGNKFFNKHIAVVGSTGSGKSHTVAKIVQNAAAEKRDFALNNSHVIIFDIHSEYRAAFPDANFLDSTNLVLPYWLLSGEELEEFFLDTEANDHNQQNVFKDAVLESRKVHYTGFDDVEERIHMDTPLPFDIRKVLKHVIDRNEEMIDTGEVYKTGEKRGNRRLLREVFMGDLQIL